MKRRVFVALFAVAVTCVCAWETQAEIHKEAITTEKGIVFLWWPRLQPPSGWRQDVGASRHNGINALVPIGSDFSSAQTVLYARAVFKPRVPEDKTLEEFIASDRKRFEGVPDKPGMAEAAPLATADGAPLRSITFFPTSPGNWERVCYGEEGDFYLVFVVSSRSREGYEKAMPVYEQMVRGYVRGRG